MREASLSLAISTTCGSPRCGLLEEAARFGPLTVLLWSDEAVEKLEGRPPKFPEQERRYFLEAIRYVDRVALCRNPAAKDNLSLPEGLRPQIWVVDEANDNDAKRAYCRDYGLQYRVVRRGNSRRPRVR